MNRTQRKLFLGFATYVAVILAAITAVLSCVVYQREKPGQRTILFEIFFVP